MNKLLFMLCALFAFINANAQQKASENESKSVAVELLSKDGVLFKKEFHKIGAVGGVSFENIIITDVSTGHKTGALRLETNYYISSGNVDTYIGTLDSDEIEACLKSLKYIKSDVLPTNPTNYSEVEYKSRDGITLGAFYDDDKQTWKIWVRTKSYTNRSQKFLKADQLEMLILYFNKANEDLKSCL